MWLFAYISLLVDWLVRRIHQVISDAIYQLFVLLSNMYVKKRERIEALGTALPLIGSLDDFTVDKLAECLQFEKRQKKYKTVLNLFND